MTIDADIQSLSPGKLVTLFELDLSPITGNTAYVESDHYYFYPGLDESNAEVVWQGRTYSPFPIEADGFEMSAKGTLPRPSLRAANVTGALTALCEDYDDLIGAKIIRRRTFSQYLDGQPGADPDQHLMDDVFFIERKVGEDSLSITWELASAMDLSGLQLPNRKVVVGYCAWQYRSAECSYTGTNYFNVLDLPVASSVDDVCSKSVNGCKVRFGASANLPFGGFPAARTYRI